MTKPLPLKIHDVFPDYAPIIRRTGVNGAVYFRLLIGCDGKVQSVTIISGPEALRQVTVDAVKQWIYRPYLVNGKPASVEMTTGITSSFGG